MRASCPPALEARLLFYRIYVSLLEMTIFSLLSLIAMMVLLAAIPSASVALIVARSATRGITDGVAVACGIVVGDLILVALAVLGVSVLAESMGAMFALVKYVGGGYLLIAGIKLLRSKSTVDLHRPDSSHLSLVESFASGVVITLGDLKAILFYASVFPLFVDTAHLDNWILLEITIVTVLSVGSVKIAYAYAARRIVRRLQSGQRQRVARSAAGCCMIGAGAYLISKG